MRKIPIKLHTANAIRWLGSLYRNPADAIKEHVSNAIDEHIKSLTTYQRCSVCRVDFTMKKESVTIEYRYGLSKKEFEDILQRVANSAKKGADYKQIGQLGIGIFSFLQIGRKCTFLSKRSKDDETFKVILRDGSESAEFPHAQKREHLKEPGIRIIISELKFDPTRKRGPLSVDKLQKVFADKFDSYLKNGHLEITIQTKGVIHTVEPQQIDLPRIGKGYEEWLLTDEPSKTFSLELYFDPSGKGTVSIRHTGVTVVDDLKAISAYGIEKSIYANGDIRGYIEADFLVPLPARSGFEEDDNWTSLILELERLRPAFEAEVEELKEEESKKRLTEVQRKAIEIANEILNAEEFKDLELLEGLGRKSPEKKTPPNGFDFIPSSIRIEPNKSGKLALKAIVPKVIPDKTVVNIFVNDPSVDLLVHKLIFLSSNADDEGIVTEFVRFLVKTKTSDPVILMATTNQKTAIAHITVAHQVQKRKPKSPGKDKQGQRINYNEVAFEDGSIRHSRYISRMIQINNLNKDFKREMKGSDDDKLAYAALMIGKETITYNDRSGTVDDYLEKFLTFYFNLKNKLPDSSIKSMKKLR